MCNGIGIDLCEISRMEKLMADDRFMNRWFTPDEIRYVLAKGKGAAQTLAGLYAAREALAKALGSGIDFDLKEAEILHTQTGTPYFRLNGRLAERVSGNRILLSITHDAGVAAAVCILEQELK